MAYGREVPTADVSRSSKRRVQKLVFFDHLATETAALIIPSVGTNHERHPKLQRFMLTNDSATLAMEVPT
jgi:hypothetical protein